MGASQPSGVSSLGSDLARTSGTAGVDNLRVDYLELLPSRPVHHDWTLPTAGSLIGLVVDSYQEAVYKVDSTSGLFDGTASILTMANVTGGLKRLPKPCHRYSMSWVLTDGTTASITKTDTSSVTVYYLSQYLYVRPGVVVTLTVPLTVVVDGKHVTSKTQGLTFRRKRVGGSRTSPCRCRRRCRRSR